MTSKEYFLTTINYKTANLSTTHKMIVNIRLVKNKLRYI